MTLYWKSFKIRNTSPFVLIVIAQRRVPLTVGSRFEPVTFLAAGSRTNRHARIEQRTVFLWPNRETEQKELFFSRMEMHLFCGLDKYLVGTGRMGTCDRVTGNGCGRAVSFTQGF